MEKILIGLKNEMIANKKLPQPADGDMYWMIIMKWIENHIAKLAMELNGININLVIIIIISSLWFREEIK